jgi:hypothetical protein
MRAYSALRQGSTSLGGHRQVRRANGVRLHLQLNGPVDAMVPEEPVA